MCIMCVQLQRITVLIWKRNIWWIMWMLVFMFTSVDLWNKWWKCQLDPHQAVNIGNRIKMVLNSPFISPNFSTAAWYFINGQKKTKPWMPEKNSHITSVKWQKHQVNMCSNIYYEMHGNENYACTCYIQHPLWKSSI